jgi:hypothetical protein
MIIKGKYTDAKILKENDIYHVQISFNIKLPNRSKVKYQSSAPYDIHQSKKGTGLPFPNPETAYSENNVNSGEVEVIGNKIKFQLVRPNSYYINAGTTLVPPNIYLRFGKNQTHEELIILPFPNNL